MQLLEAVWYKMQRVHFIILHVKFLQWYEIHQVVHIDLIIRNVKVCQVLEEFQILLSNFDYVHTWKSRSDCFVRQLYSARVEKQKTIKNSLRFQVTIYTALHLLRVDFTLPFRSISYFVSVFHLRFLLFNLDHAIQIGSFHRQYMHILSFIYSVSCLTSTCDSSSVSKIITVRLIRFWVRILSVCSLELINSQVLIWYLIIIDHVSRLDKRLLLLHFCTYAVGMWPIWA